MDSCSHGERSVILPKQDIFLHHVVAQSASALTAALLPPDSQEQDQVENGAAHVRSVRHNHILFVWKRERVG